MINTVIDLSHWDFVTAWPTVKQDGIQAVIHKSTQGLSYKDPWYLRRSTHAMLSGLLWGSYHFGTAEDPVRQADEYLRYIGPIEHQLIALDLERNPNIAGSMNLDSAEKFVIHVHDKTGRWPVLYTGQWYLNMIISTHNKPTILSNCSLWLASYTTKMVLPPQWGTWRLWQYTDGQAGPPPYNVAGIGTCDRNQFNGTEEELRSWWAT